MNALVLRGKAADWLRLKGLVLDSVSSPITRRVYNLALDELIEWYGLEPRPGFSKAVVSAWRVALETRDRPVALILTRQHVPTLDRGEFAAADGLRRGAYILAEPPNARPDLILIATGSEVGLVVAAARQLLERNVHARVVSMPSWELFDAQPVEYRDAVLSPSISARLAVEAGASQGWHRYVGDHGDVLGVDRFGASAPGDVLLREFGFTVENVCRRALAMLR